jgi:hypothetical protein
MKKTIIALSLAMLASSLQAATVTAANITQGFISLNAFSNQGGAHTDSDTITGSPYTFRIEVKDLAGNNGQQLTITAYKNATQTSLNKIYEFSVEDPTSPYFSPLPAQASTDQDVTVKTYAPLFPGNETWLAQDSLEPATIRVLDLANGKAWIDYNFADIYSAYGERVSGTICIGGIAGDCAAAPEVPVPAAAWLMGSGLVGLAGIARRRRM